MSKEPKYKHVSPDFPGNGNLKCYICGKSLVTHTIGPCPKLNGERIVVRRGRVSKRNDERTGQ